MPRMEYRYEVEAKRLSAGHCPQCNFALLHHKVSMDFRCSNPKCAIIFAEADFHQAEGYAVIRNLEDDRPTIQGAPETS